jgi:hypothetical protein
MKMCNYETFKQQWWNNTQDYQKYEIYFNNIYHTTMVVYKNDLNENIKIMKTRIKSDVLKKFANSCFKNYSDKPNGIKRLTTIEENKIYYNVTHHKEKNTIIPFVCLILSISYLIFLYTYLEYLRIDHYIANSFVFGLIIGILII